MDKRREPNMSRCRAGRAVARALAASRGRNVVSLELYVEPDPAGRASNRTDARPRAKGHRTRSRDVPFFHRLY